MYKVSSSDRLIQRLSLSNWRGVPIQQTVKVTGLSLRYCSLIRPGNMNRPLPVVITLAIIASVLLVSLVHTEPKAYAQLYRTLTIRSCRLDQAFFTVRLTDKLGSTVVAGEIAGGSFGGFVRAFVTGTTNLGETRTAQGQTGSGYAGLSFVAELPVGMSFLNDVVVCIR